MRVSPVFNTTNDAMHFPHSSTGLRRIPLLELSRPKTRPPGAARFEVGGFGWAWHWMLRRKAWARPGQDPACSEHFDQDAVSSPSKASNSSVPAPECRKRPNELHKTCLKEYVFCGGNHVEKPAQGSYSALWYQPLTPTVLIPPDRSMR